MVYRQTGRQKGERGVQVGHVIAKCIRLLILSRKYTHYVT